MKIFKKLFGKKSVEIKPAENKPEILFYNNPENLSEDEIHRKIMTMGFGPNRNKRCELLGNYSTLLISKQQWINAYCEKN